MSVRITQPQGGFGRSFSVESRASRFSARTSTPLGRAPPPLPARIHDPAAASHAMSWGHAKVEGRENGHENEPSPLLQPKSKADGRAEQAVGSAGEVQQLQQMLAMLTKQADNQEVVLNHLVTSSSEVITGIQALSQRLDEQSLKIEIITRTMCRTSPINLQAPDSSEYSESSARNMREKQLDAKSPIYLSAAKSPIIKPRLPSDLVAVAAGGKAILSTTGDMHKPRISPRGGKRTLLTPRSACSGSSVPSSVMTSSTPKHSCASWRVSGAHMPRVP